MHVWGKHFIVVDILSKEHILEQATAFEEYITVKVSLFLEFVLEYLEKCGFFLCLIGKRQRWKQGWLPWNS